MKPHYYIASGFTNVAAVRALKEILDEAGWHHTYDWTAKQGETLSETADLEIQAVLAAHVVIVLLPGGRGTHTELGCAISMKDCYAPNSRIVIFSPTPAVDFGPDGSVFYHHKSVERFGNYNAMVASLLEKETL